MNVYDFDGTIYDGDSSIDFIKFCFKKNIKCLLLIPKYIFVFFLYMIRFYDKEELKSTFFEVVKYFKDIDSVVLKFWEKYEYKLKKKLFINNKNNLIISASPDFLLRPIALKYKMKLIATCINKETGSVIGNNCFGKEKVKRLKKEDILEIDNFYSE